MASSKIATAYVQVMPSMEGVAPKVKSFFGATGKSAGGSFGSNLVSTIKTAIAAAGIGNFLKDTLIEGANLQQSLGGVETLFKDSAENVIASAEQAYKTAGMSANEYMETVTGFSASLLQSLSEDTQAAATVADMALTDMSDNANKMGTSMELIQNAYQGFAKQNYTMLDNLKLGYGGTKTEMERLLADAQELTGIEYDISNLADVYEAIHVIQEEMGITGATAQEASSTITGSFNAMKAAFSNVLGNLTLGRDIQPSLDALALTTKTFLVDNLVPAVGNIFSALPGSVSTLLKELIPENVDDVVTSAITKFTEYVTANLPSVLASGSDTLGSFIKGIAGMIPTLSDSAVQIVGSLAQFIINDPGKLLEPAGVLLASLGTGIADAIPELMTTAADVVIALGGYLVDHAGDILSSAWEVGVKIVEGIWNGIAGVWNSIINIPGLLDGLNFGINVNAGTYYDGPTISSANASKIISSYSNIKPNFAAINGSHASGLDYVPYDGYIAELHKGEMVLTRSQARAFRSESGESRGVTVNQYIYSEAKTAADLMEEARYQQEMAVMFDV